MMLFADVPVYLHREPVDFRKSINGLAGIVEQDMTLSPMEPGLFVFRAKRRDRIKVLYWDRNGFCLWHKRLEQDLFCWPAPDDAVMALSAEQFDWLLRGLDVEKLKPHPARLFSVSS
jgi:transposase